MEEQVSRLVDKVWDKLLHTPPERRLLIGIGGMPGSGKTTLSKLLVKSLNERYNVAPDARPDPAAAEAPLPPLPKSVVIAAYLPMDGFHLTRAQLAAMPDPEEARRRRGAEWTFDGAAFLGIVQALREPLPPFPSSPEAARAARIFAPSFDHAIKDPVAGDISIEATDRVVVFEGNYVALGREPWRSAAALMDELWFVQVDPDVARRRLIRRHVEAGIAADETEADVRARSNDLPNGELIVKERLDVDEVVVSKEDGAWVC